VSPRVALELGRVSNLPTVWTNVLAGCVLAGAWPGAAGLAALATAFSLFYVGGMYLNDAFDRHWDASHRPERPIPSGRAGAMPVFAIGFVLLAAGLAGVVAVARRGSEPPWTTLVAGVALAALIVLYDAWHKGNALAPVLMGLCRAGVYVTAGLAAGGTLRPALLAGAGLGAAWVTALSLVARHEARAPAPRRLRLGRAVTFLIAGISLIDAVLLAAMGRMWLALAAGAGAVLTLGLQSLVRGT
jgi:4-hydroxybenzoate polyprenyltransferase